MCENKVVYYSRSMTSGYIWAAVHGEELLNFIQTYDERLAYTVQRWKETGEKRFVYGEYLHAVLACFPLEYEVKYF